MPRSNRRRAYRQRQSLYKKPLHARVLEKRDAKQYFAKEAYLETFLSLINDASQTRNSIKNTQRKIKNLKAFIQGEGSLAKAETKQLEFLAQFKQLDERGIAKWLRKGVNVYANVFSTALEESKNNLDNEINSRLGIERETGMERDFKNWRNLLGMFESYLRENENVFAVALNVRSYGLPVAHQTFQTLDALRKYFEYQRNFIREMLGQRRRF